MIIQRKYINDNIVLNPLFTKHHRLKSALLSLLLICILSVSHLTAQTITGAWKGKIGNLRTELKLVKKGDSLVGTSYYFASKTKYRRYAVKGYFDPETNSVIWWDDILLEEKGSGFPGSNREPFLSVADFNCPGENTMLLEGKTSAKDDKDKQAGIAAMQKIDRAQFVDEWDYVLDNYLSGTNHPDIIDSVANIAFGPAPVPQGYEAAPEPSQPVLASSEPPVVPSGSATTPPMVTISKATPLAVSIEQKFLKRSNKLQTVIPIKNEKIELRFYDNAQIDGDSIALFLNGNLLFKNIRLTDQPYTVYLDANDLQDDNELVMVAENLGSIPPNTSFMVAIVGTKRYEARLYANENSSALIRFIKQ